MPRLQRLLPRVARPQNAVTALTASASTEAERAHITAVLRRGLSSERTLVA